VQTARSITPLGEDVLGRALDQFRQVLHERGLKMSGVREAIARAALTYEGHFSAEHLFRALQAKGVREAHLATVYRALPLMVEAGLVLPALVTKADGQRYEASFEREHHDHLVCTGCGRVIEYRSEALEALQQQIAETYDFHLEDHVHELRGRCADCHANGPTSRTRTR
jgi:Fur family ferric uptake transcriptional regulator